MPHISKPSLNLLMIGSTGRIGEKLKGKLSESGHKVTTVTRGDPHSKDQKQLNIKVVDPTSLTIKEWEKMMKENKIQVLLNLAAQSTGNLKSMIAVNVEMPKKIAEACKNLGIPMVHTCSLTTQKQGLKEEEHPYASTKKMASKALEEYPNAVIVKLGAVLGGKSDVPVCTDAAVSTWSPIIILPSEGSEKVFHPIDEATVIEALEKIVEHLTDPSKEGQKLPKYIDIAGQEVPLKAFLKMVNPRAIGSLKLPEAIGNLLAKLVDKGVFTKEFFKIAKLPDENSQPDLTTMENVLKINIPSAEKVAQEASKQLSLFNTTTTIVKSFFKVTHKKPLVLVAGATWPTNFLDVAKTVTKQFYANLKSSQKE